MPLYLTLIKGYLNTTLNTYRSIATFKGGNEKYVTSAKTEKLNYT